MDSRLEAIRQLRNTGGRGISFAYASDANVVRCESATSIYEGGGSTEWKIKLAKDDDQETAVIWSRRTRTDSDIIRPMILQG